MNATAAGPANAARADARPRLLFISPRFLFPAHSGGAIRTGQILAGMKGGRFRVTVASPATALLERVHQADLERIADDWRLWPAVNTEDRSRLSKARHLLDALPLTVAADRSRAGLDAVGRALADQPDVVVVDFVHAAALLPRWPTMPTVVFTHNCEAEIYERHADNEPRGWMKWVWRQQARKMKHFEADVLKRAERVVAVAERDAQRFSESYGIDDAQTIPTGVELERFPWREPQGSGRVVFAGSMDSAANIDGVQWLLDNVWPQVVRQRPAAQLVIVGKKPPDELVRQGDALRGVQFTGRVPDVVPYMAGADAFVIPLRVGGGTRMKAFEAMAAGAPLVSTELGVEGLDLVAGRHYLSADDASTMTAAIVRLLDDVLLRQRLSTDGRRHVEQHASHRAAAQRFESICLAAMQRRPADTADQRPPGLQGVLR